MDAKETRRLNLIKLIEKDTDNKSRIAEKINTSSSYLSTIISENGDGNVGERLARSIENAYGLEHGWLDHPHDEGDEDIEAQRSEFKTLESQLTEEERAHLNELMRLIIEKRKVLDKLL